MPKPQQDIAVGQRWRSRDRRDNGKIVTVEEVDERINEPGNNMFVHVRSVMRTRMRASTLRTRYELVSGPRA